MTQLEPLNDDRRCFRHVGGVLVERTVGEAKPQIKQRFEQLHKQYEELAATRTAKSKELSEYMQVKFDLNLILFKAIFFEFFLI